MQIDANGVARSGGQEDLSPTHDDLLAVFNGKYRRHATLGWGPALRLRHDYFTPDDQYEALVNRLLNPGQAWCDVGCGRDMFPSFPELARQIAARAGYVLGIDPDDNIKENRFITEGFHGIVEDCPTERKFDLVTMRMVAEHLVDPARALRRIADMLKPGGRLVIYTPHKWAPMSIVASIVPFALHNPFKRLLWATESRDTFPTCYRLNTRADMQRHGATAGLREIHYRRLDDCRITAGYKWLNQLELWLRAGLNSVGLGYPEACILAVYEKPR